ncbi:hypothetical protein CYMTET_14469 [Cymbomonas tetramitiformis]|uniref:Uncharacterized protein n=1 Tax=Cymbomonas tetramitiformis TaxID=36881 RepID=A0AAE0GG13_9CHLO|nr:hypothetical protein CYMTET_14469 [Cymbomonas tetramitiformis]
MVHVPSIGFNVPSWTPFSRFGKSRKFALSRKPIRNLSYHKTLSTLVRRSCSSGATFVLSGVFSQAISTGRVDDGRLLLSQATYGGLMGPVLHIWYGMLSAAFPGQLARATFHCATWIPLVCHSHHAWSLSMGKRFPLAASWQSARREAPRKAAIGISIWFPINLYLFQCPLSQQVYLTNAVQLAWFAILASTTGRKGQDKPS